MAEPPGSASAGPRVVDPETLARWPGRERAARLETVPATPQAERTATVAAARREAEAFVADDLGPIFAKLLERLTERRRPVVA